MSAAINEMSSCGRNYSLRTRVGLWVIRVGAEMGTYQWVRMGMNDGNIFDGIHFQTKPNLLLPK